MASNISDDGDESHDADSDDGDSQIQEHEHEEIKDIDSSVGTPQSLESLSNNGVHTP